MKKVMMFYYNFLGALTMRVFRGPAPARGTLRRSIQDAVEGYVTDGCEKYTPVDHRWADGPMF